MAAQLTPAADVLYLYGISAADTAKVVESTGVDDRSRVIGIQCQGLLCWVSRVSEEEFGSRLAQNMENLDWVARTSVAHQRAISAIARETDILPARLATVFRSEDSLSRHIGEQLETFKRDLARVKGADEWGIKIFVLDSPIVPARAIRSGKDYLKAKAALLPKQRQSPDTAKDLAEFGKALEAISLESAPPGKVSSGQRGIAFQTSILVKRSDRKRLESVLGKFSQRWAASRRIECTGPWPPYSFVSRVESD
jgi:hypothetical protein